MAVSEVCNAAESSASDRSLQRIQAEQVKGLRREELRLRAEIVSRELRSSAARVLELGCGHGHFLVAYAKAFPEEDCFGIDICRERIFRALRKAGSAQVSNVSFFHGSAQDFLAIWAARGRFRRVFILFPDPWPKRRHMKNRIIKPDFLTTLADSMESDGEVFFRTDSRNYFDEAVDIFGRHARWQIPSSTEWPFEHATVFQSKADVHFSLRRVTTG